MRSYLIALALLAAPAAHADDLQCLTDNVFDEAGGEPLAGRVAVGQVTLNRAARHQRSVCEEVYYKHVNPRTGKKEAAFSWTLGLRWRPHGIDPSARDACREIARALLSGELRSERLPAGTEYYHATYVNPGWTRLTRVAKIGHHVFYRRS